MTKPTQEDIKKLFQYHPDTGIFIRLVDAGGRAKAGDIVGSDDLYGYKTVRINNKSYKLHRLAWLYVYGDWPNGDIDHLNCVRSDNRISNLRDVDRKTNLENQRYSKNNKSTGVLGVYKQGKSFEAKISMYNKSIHLGSFKTIEEAQAAYIEAKRKLHIGCTI